VPSPLERDGPAGDGDSNGRTALYLGSLSSSLVALALVAQQLRFGDVFPVFVLTVLPALLFLGLVTYVRVLHNSVEDIIYARAINRGPPLRHRDRPHPGPLLPARRGDGGPGARLRGPRRGPLLATVVGAGFGGAVLALHVAYQVHHFTRMRTAVEALFPSPPWGRRPARSRRTP
jgi:hypothetical protein